MLGLRYVSGSVTAVVSFISAPSTIKEQND